MYKFCKAGCWWLVIKSLEELLDYKNKTDFRYGQILTDPDAEIGKNKNIIHLATRIAERKECSIAEGMSEIATRTFESQIDCLNKGHAVWINKNGGWNIGMENVEATVYMNNLIYPNYKINDIVVKKWTPDSKHYYARIGNIEVSEGEGNNKIIKWDTYDEAYAVALRYCEELR